MLNRSVVLCITETRDKELENFPTTKIQSEMLNEERHLRENSIISPRIVLLTDFSSFKSQYINTFPVIAFSLRIGAKLSIATFNSLTCPNKLIKSSQLNFDSFTCDKSCVRVREKCWKLAIKLELKSRRKRSPRRWE